MKKFVKIYLLLLVPLFSCGQNDSSLIQFSGMVLTSDSLATLPYCAIRNNHFKLLAITDAEGFFSLAVRKGDTMYFSEVGFKSAKYIVPLNMEGMKYSVVQLMSPDTTYLPEVVIHSWPTKRQFDYQMVHGDFNDDAITNARQRLSEKERDKISNNMAMDASENYRQYLNQQYQRYYYMGQSPPIRLLDPLAWKSFFDAWSSGKFKKKKYD